MSALDRSGHVAKGPPSAVLSSSFLPLRRTRSILAACETTRQAGDRIAIFFRRLPAASTFGDFQGGHDETSSIFYRSRRRRRRGHDRQAGDRAIQSDDQMAIDGKLAKITRHALWRL